MQNINHKTLQKYFVSVVLYNNLIHLTMILRPFFFDYLVYGSADPILQDIKKKKNYIFLIKNYIFLI